MASDCEYYIWTKKMVHEDDDDYTYKCGCGVIMDSEVEYNADTGHYECSVCGSESPDLENIKNVT